MAICPSCDDTIDAAAVRCNSCGYQFPKTLPKDRTALAWGFLSDAALCAGAVMSMVGVVVALLFVIVAIVQGRPETLVSGVFGSVYMFGQYVVFTRAHERD